MPIPTPICAKEVIGGAHKSKASKDLWMIRIFFIKISVAVVIVAMVIVAMVIVAMVIVAMVIVLKPLKVFFARVCPMQSCGQTTARSGQVLSGQFTIWLAAWALPLTSNS
jgi:hypothetical protein